MGEEHRSEVFEVVGEIPRLQTRVWRVERIGWLLMAAAMAAGLLGVWGHGPISSTEASSGKLTATYERFVRNVGQNELIVRVAPGSAENGRIRVRISQDYLSTNQVQAMAPEPTSTAVAGGDLVFEFPASDRSGLTLRIDTRPTGGMGVREAKVAVLTDSIQIRQFVYP